MSYVPSEGVASPTAHAESNKARAPPDDPTSSSTATPLRSRARHACDRCRASRSKCSGGNRCSRCTKDDADCVYSDRKRERNKKGLIEGAERIRHLEHDKRLLIEALTDVVNNSAVETEQLRDATDLLAKFSADLQEEASSSTISPSRSTISMILEKSLGQSELTSGSGEKRITTALGSPGRHGEMQHMVHLNHGSGMTGYIGKMSEVSWMQSIREQVVGQPMAVGSDATPAQLDVHSAQAHDLTYFMDDENLLSVNEDDVDPQQLPPPTAALILCEAYFHALQGVFQFIRRGLILRILYQLFTEPQHPTWAGRRTMALANIIWALGAKWLNDTKVDQPDFAEHHLTYYARARALGLDHRILFDHPDVQMTQSIGILAFYLLKNGSIQRAWSVLGQAVRHATALGVNLRVAPGIIEDSVYEDRAALWYSLYQLEVLLSEMTGRSMCIRSLDFALQIPPMEPLDQSEQSPGHEAADGPVQAQSRVLWQSLLGLHRGVALKMSGGAIPWDRFVPVGSNISPQHFTARLALSKISDEIGTKLYSGATTMTWFDHQRETRALDGKLQAWSESLPPELQVDFGGQAIFDPRSRLELAMYHHSVRMILWRPYLREIVIEDESAASTNFNREGALACVQSALHMMDTMPDAPVAADNAQILPWWPLLHYLCQAAAVILLELSMDMQHMQGGTTTVVLALRKATNYLWVLAQPSKSAYKAWNIIRCLADKVLGRYDTDISSSIPVEAPPKPWNWDSNDETRIEVVLQTLR